MKILLLGSHPSVSKIAAVKGRLMGVYSKVFAMNNAWSVLGAFPQYWLHASDFHKQGTLFPSYEERACFLGERDSFLKTPRWYTFPGTGTMLLNSLYHIHNCFAPGLAELHVLGADCDYENARTHFYGCGKMNGTTRRLLENTEFEGKAADPLRYGVPPMLLALHRAERDLAGVKLVTLSDNPRQLLPFARLSIESIFP